MKKIDHKQPKKKGIWLSVFAVAILLTISIGAVSAFYNANMLLTNKMSIANSKVEFVEHFISESKWLPGETVNKKPYLNNTGETDLLVRIKVTEQWVNSEGTVQSGVDADIVQKNYTDAWQNDWIEGNDGYFYYKKVLKAGTASDVILKSIALSPEASNDSHAFNYSNLQYNLMFQSEFALTESASQLTIWNADVTINNGMVNWTFNS